MILLDDLTMGIIGDLDGVLRLTKKMVEKVVELLTA